VARAFPGRYIIGFGLLIGRFESFFFHSVKISAIRPTKFEPLLVSRTATAIFDSGKKRFSAERSFVRTDGELHDLRTYDLRTYEVGTRAPAASPSFGDRPAKIPVRSYFFENSLPKNPSARCRLMIVALMSFPSGRRR
jgi:hypothetical protein